MANDLLWLLGSDLHFPLHDPRKVELFIKVMRALRPDAVDFVGDIDDADSTSRWAEGTPDANVSILEGGVKETRELFAQTRDILPDADIHMHDGNHGWTRHKLYMQKKAPALLEILNSDAIYEYSKYGIHWHEYDKPPVHRFGDMYVHHGESVSKHAGESVRNDCLSWGVSLIRGHSHRMGSYFKSYPLTGQQIRGFEIGHMCDEKKMDYDFAPDWAPGFAFAHVENGEWPHVQLIQISKDYTCFVDGIRFSA